MWYTTTCKGFKWHGCVCGKCHLLLTTSQTPLMWVLSPVSTSIVKDSRHLPIDTGFRHLPIDRGFRHLPIDTGFRHLSIDTGFRHLPIDTGFRHLPIDTGFRHLPIDTGFRHLPIDRGFTYQFVITLLAFNPQFV
jgi:hypothetical protein